MRGKFGFFAGSAIARGIMSAALATGVAAGGLALGAAPAIAKEKAPKAGEFSPAFSKAAQPFQVEMNKLAPLVDAIVKAPKEGQAAAMAAAAPTATQIITMLPPVEAAASTARDKLVLGGWMRQLGQIARNTAVAQRGAQFVVESGLAVNDKGEAVAASPAQLMDNKFALLAYADGNKDNATVIRVGEELIAGNYRDDQAADAVARSYVKQQQPAEALAAYKKAIAARRAASQPIPDTWYQNANRIAYEAKMGPQAIEWVTMQVQDKPSPFTWLGAAQIVRQFSTFTPQESLDLGRLLKRADGFNNDPRYVEREYVEYIEAASKAGIPAEVFAAATAGVNAKVLKTTGDPFVTDALREGKLGADKDRAALTRDEAAARAGADGRSALSAGDSYLAFGNAAKAEEMFELAVQKGGIDKDRALTRQGIAEIDGGKYAEAKVTLAQVTGVRAPLAKLFWVLADNKSKGAAAAPAAPAG